MTRKYTKTTFKTFIKNNAENLYIKNLSHFDSMEDGVRSSARKEYRKAEKSDLNSQENTYGINGVWLVGGGRDYFSGMYDAGFHGILVENCCGSFVVAVPAAAKGA